MTARRVECYADLSDRYEDRYVYIIADVTFGSDGEATVVFVEPNPLDYWPEQVKKLETAACETAQEIERLEQRHRDWLANGEATT